MSGTWHRRAAGNKPRQKTDASNDDGNREKQSDFHSHPES